MDKRDSGKMDQVKGEAKDVKGRVERQAGEWTGNPNTQLKGTADQIAGKTQKAVGKMKSQANQLDKQADADARRRAKKSAA